MPTFEFSDDHYFQITDLLLGIRNARAAWEAATVVDEHPWSGPGVHPGRVVTTLDDLDEDAFRRHGNKMLDAVAAFWEGLDEQRRGLEQTQPSAAERFSCATCRP